MWSGPLKKDQKICPKGSRPSRPGPPPASRPRSQVPPVGPGAPRDGSPSGLMGSIQRPSRLPFSPPSPAAGEGGPQEPRAPGTPGPRNPGPDRTGRTYLGPPVGTDLLVRDIAHLTNPHGS